ncbi:MAG: hypothetical protein M3228_08475 [Actinomycetota bacterium]|nr:hypothetical protein [Actinomycetota bacterium]
MGTESPERVAIQAGADRFLDALRGWLAIPSIGSEPPLRHHGAEGTAHLWRLPGALR